VTVKLNSDFGIAGMSSNDLQAVAAAWQPGAISRETMFELFRSGEIFPDGRTNQDKANLVLAAFGPISQKIKTTDERGWARSVVCNFAICVTLESNVVLTAVGVSAVLSAEPTEIGNRNCTNFDKLLNRGSVSVASFVESR